MKKEIHRNETAAPWTYADLDARQRECRDGVLRGGEGAILFSEVSPVITLGHRETESDLDFAREVYAARGITLLDVRRGGRATYHGPGQWVVFVVDSLERLTGDRRGVRAFVDGLFSAALEVCRERYVAAEIRSGAEAGVWSEPGPTGKKLAALGVRIDAGVTQHGLSLNVFHTPESFFGIRPCGLDAPVGFLEPEAPPGAECESRFLHWRVRLEAALVKRFSRDIPSIR